MSGAMARPGGNAIYSVAANDLTWIDASRPGLRMAPVMQDRERGQFLGLLGFEPFASTGLHQHLDIAFSYFLDGGLTDYQGSTRAGQMGINLAGATHDAIAYRRTLTASRLEGPVLYEGPGDANLQALHSGARTAAIVNDAPETMPDINICVERLPVIATSVPGITRRIIYDYHKVQRDGRSVELNLLPGSATPAFRLTAPLSLFVVGGAVTVNDVAVTAGGFGIVEPGPTLRLRSPYGACCLVWSEGAMQWDDRAGMDLFGF